MSADQLHGLSLCVKEGDVIEIGGDIKIAAKRYSHTQTRVLIDAPREIKIRHIKAKWNEGKNENDSTVTGSVHT